MSDHRVESSLTASVSKFAFSIAAVEAPMNFPDLPPWLDSVSDEDDELSSGDHETPYDE